MLGGQLLPDITLFLVHGSGNLVPAGVEYRADVQTGFRMRVGGYFQGADARYRDSEAEGKSLGRADSNP